MNQFCKFSLLTMMAVLFLTMGVLQAETPQNNTQSSPQPASVSPEPSQPSGSEAEMKELIEQRRKMVLGGAGLDEIRGITEQIQDRYKLSGGRKAKAHPPGMIQVSPDIQKQIADRFAMSKQKMELLAKKYQELASQKASQNEIQAIAMQMEAERRDYQQFVQEMLKKQTNLPADNKS